MDNIYDTTQNCYIDVKTVMLNALCPGRNKSIVQSDADYMGINFETLRRTVLPSIRLPKFSGNQLEWKTYKKMFMALVYNVASVPPFLKLQYLIGSLTGDAAKRLKYVQIKSGNYEGAWAAMLKRYDNKRINLSVHMHSILSCPPVSRKS